MSLVGQIDSDLKTALKEKNEAKLSCLRMLKSAFKNQAIDARVAELNDEQAITVIKRELKKRQDAVSQFTSGNRPELAAKEQEEAQILSQYLPPSLPEEELIKIIDEVVAGGQNNFGQVMKAVMAKVGAQADGQTIQRLVKNKLGL